MLLVSASREHLKRQVWNKARIVPGADPAVWRKDPRGAVIRYADHGNRESPYGWVIHHVIPPSQGGGDALSNLQPLNTSRRRDFQVSRPWAR